MKQHSLKVQHAEKYGGDKKGENLLHELFEKQVTSTDQSLRRISTKQTAALYVSVSIFFSLIARMHMIAWSDRVKDTQMRDRGGERDIKHECADIAEAFGRWWGCWWNLMMGPVELQIALALSLFVSSVLHYTAAVKEMVWYLILQMSNQVNHILNQHLFISLSVPSIPFFSSFFEENSKFWCDE